MDDTFFIHTWIIDWNKVNSFEDLKKILMGMDLFPKPYHPDFDEIRPFCKLIDQDGREVDPNTLQYK